MCAEGCNRWWWLGGQPTVTRNAAVEMLPFPSRFVQFILQASPRAKVRGRGSGPGSRGQTSVRGVRSCGRQPPYPREGARRASASTPTPVGGSLTRGGRLADPRRTFFLQGGRLSSKQDDSGQPARHGPRPRCQANGEVSWGWAVSWGEGRLGEGLQRRHWAPPASTENLDRGDRKSSIVLCRLEHACQCSPCAHIPPRATFRALCMPVLTMCSHPPRPPACHQEHQDNVQGQGRPDQGGQAGARR
jgi:hypothetical protein